MTEPERAAQRDVEPANHNHEVPEQRHRVWHNILPHEQVVAVLRAGAGALRIRTLAQLASTRAHSDHGETFVSV